MIFIYDERSWNLGFTIGHGKVMEFVWSHTRQEPLFMFLFHLSADLREIIDLFSAGGDLLGLPKDKHCVSCAVVGNGGVMTNSGKGEEIDSHELVFRWVWYYSTKNEIKGEEIDSHDLMLRWVWNYSTKNEIKGEEIDIHDLVFRWVWYYSTKNEIKGEEIDIHDLVLRWVWN